MAKTLLPIGPQVAKMLSQCIQKPLLRIAVREEYLLREPRAHPTSTAVLRVTLDVGKYLAFYLRPGKESPAEHEVLCAEVVNHLDVQEKLTLHSDFTYYSNAPYSGYRIYFLNLEDTIGQLIVGINLLIRRNKKSTLETPVEGFAFIFENGSILSCVIEPITSKFCVPHQISHSFIIEEGIPSSFHLASFSS